MPRKNHLAFARPRSTCCFQRNLKKLLSCLRSDYGRCSARIGKSFAYERKRHRVKNSRKFRFVLHALAWWRIKREIFAPIQKINMFCFSFWRKYLKREIFSASERHKGSSFKGFVSTHSADKLAFNFLAKNSKKAHGIRMHTERTSPKAKQQEAISFIKVTLLFTIGGHGYTAHIHSVNWIEVN